ncbi:unnamed protein product [Calicophoron daubneyi]
MLSEPRKKVRYSNNPNGNLWANDADGFGRKMLKKLGWSPGTGLGKNSDGISKPIKPSAQHTRKGLGRKLDYSLGDDKQLDDYAQLLKSLNEKHNAEKQITGSKSLEGLPRVSSSRMSYSKFVKAKDASKYNQKALAVILGEKQVSRSNEPAQDALSHGQSPVSPADPRKFGVKTVSSALSMTEYFKMRKSELALKRAGIPSPSVVADILQPTEDNKSETDACKSKKRRKKRRSSSPEVAEEVSHSNSDANKVESLSVLSALELEEAKSPEAVSNLRPDPPKIDLTAVDSLPPIPCDSPFARTNLLSISGYAPY